LTQLIFFIGSFTQSLFGAYANGTYVVNYPGHFLESVGYPIDQATDIVNTASNFVVLIIYFIGYRVAIKAYRVWRKVQNFDDYKVSVEKQLEVLRARDQERSAKSKEKASRNADPAPPPSQPGSVGRFSQSKHLTRRVR
jgi:hypothetical protein